MTFICSGTIRGFQGTCDAPQSLHIYAKGIGVLTLHDRLQTVMVRQTQAWYSNRPRSFRRVWRLGDPGILACILDKATGLSECTYRQPLGTPGRYQGLWDQSENPKRRPARRRSRRACFSFGDVQSRLGGNSHHVQLALWRVCEPWLCGVRSRTPRRLWSSYIRQSCQVGIGKHG